MGVGGIYWLKQAMEMQGLVPWFIAVMSLVIANRNAQEIPACLLTAASFYLTAYLVRDLGVQNLWVGYEAGVQYFLGFTIAFTLMYHAMLSFFAPLYTAIVKRIHP